MGDFPRIRKIAILKNISKKSGHWAGYGGCNQAKKFTRYTTVVSYDFRWWWCRYAIKGVIPSIGSRWGWFLSEFGTWDFVEKYLLNKLLLAIGLFTISSVLDNFPFFLSWVKIMIFFWRNFYIFHRRINRLKKIICFPSICTSWLVSGNSRFR